ncbi:MAG: TerC/Alx family metal homeostasis membrane protein [Proteobacteria bacterium]|nr:TerC/Alx family metal homeostasis membrane protein [Pseudomonadota bacterium]
MTIWIWAGFLLLVALFVALDLGVFHREPRVVSTTEALLWTAAWVGVALCFNLLVYVIYQHHWLGMGLSAGQACNGRQAALMFLTGYLIEKSLSLDNIFIIALLFSYFRVPLRLQHRVLFWGVLGAVVMRAAMIGTGAALIARFSWTIYLFGGLLLFTAAKMLVVRQDNIDPERNLLVRAARRLFPVCGSVDDGRFFVRGPGGGRAVTPLFLVLVLVESSDVVFAVDSVPAIFAVTRDPFLVFTSNVFAILGLRSLYFALAAILDRFRYLKTSLVFLLAFVGVKMLLSHHYPLPTAVSLAVIVGILAVGIGASLLEHRRIAAVGLLHSMAEMGRANAALRQLRRVVVAVMGGTVILTGVAMLVLPGPGMVVILVGLSLLATEFVWARRLLRKAEEQGRSWVGKIEARRRRRTSQRAGDSAAAEPTNPDALVDAPCDAPVEDAHPDPNPSRPPGG